MAREARNSKNKTKQNKNTHTHTHTHKVSHFCFYYVKKLTSGRILYIFILSLINSKSTELPPSLGRLWVNGQTSYKRLRASSHEPGRWPGWPGQRDEYRLGFYEKFQPGFWDEKRPKMLGTSSGAKFEKQSKHGETIIVTFAPIIASTTL